MAGDEDYDELFSAPVEDFVAERDALVRKLKASGDKDQAAVVKTWRRPSRVVGALNRLALSGGDVVGDFVDAARAVGASSGSGLREANDRFRAAVRQAASSAVDGLDQARPSDLGEVTTALLTVGADPDALASFEEGRLLDLPDAGQAGFGFGLGVEPGPAPDRQRTQKARPRAARTKGDGAREDDLAARRRAAERSKLEAAVDAATAGQRAAAKAADVARAGVESARARVEAARRELEEAEAALATSEEAVGAADDDVAESGAALERAEAALDEHEG